MNEPLCERNQIINLQPYLNNSDSKPKRLLRLPRVDELLNLSLNEINFGQCIIGSVHQRKISIILKENQEQPRIISLTINCQDQLLNDQPQLIFGVRKETPLEYFPEFKFKASQRGMYSFIVGVKTPNINNYAINCQLLVKIEGAQGIMIVNISQTTCIPEIKCSKELVNVQGMRVIKLGVIKEKSRKDIKVTFKSLENSNFTLFSQLFGLEGEQRGQVEVKPKMVEVRGKGIFALTFTTTCPDDLQQGWISLRKVLLLRLKNTNIHFHFALEVTFYPESKRREPSVE